MEWRRTRVTWRSQARRWRYNWPVPSVTSSFSSRLLLQIIVAGCILLFVLGLQKMPFSPARRVEEGIRHLVTSEFDFRGVLQRTVPVMLGDGERRLPVFRWPWQRQEPPGAPEVPGTFPAEPLLPESAQLVMPVAGEVVSGFGWRRNDRTGRDELHEGVDIRAAAGTPVVAVLKGRVREVRDSDALGRVVEVDHGGGLASLYAGLGEILVSQGQAVERGQTIALVGKTAGAEPYLHFELRFNGTPIEPMAWLEEGR